MLCDALRNITCSCGFWRVAFLICGVLRCSAGYNFGTLATGRFCEVVVRNLQVVFPCDLLAISWPPTDDVGRKNFFELSLPTGPHVVPELLPGRQVGTPDDSGELRADGLPWSVSPDETCVARLRLVPPFFEVRTQFGKKRDDAKRFRCMVFGLGTIHPNTVRVPVHRIETQSA